MSIQATDSDDKVELGSFELDGSEGGSGDSSDGVTASVAVGTEANSDDEVEFGSFEPDRSVDGSDDSFGGVAASEADGTEFTFTSEAVDSEYS